jgi:hypothetical protein
VSLAPSQGERDRRRPSGQLVGDPKDPSPREPRSGVYVWRLRVSLWPRLLRPKMRCDGGVSAEAPPSHRIGLNRNAPGKIPTDVVSEAQSIGSKAAVASPVMASTEALL